MSGVSNHDDVDATSFMGQMAARYRERMSMGFAVSNTISPEAYVARQTETDGKPAAANEDNVTLTLDRANSFTEDVLKMSENNVNSPSKVSLTQTGSFSSPSMKELITKFENRSFTSSQLKEGDGAGGERRKTKELCLGDDTVARMGPEINRNFSENMAESIGLPGADLVTLVAALNDMEAMHDKFEAELGFNLLDRSTQFKCTPEDNAPEIGEHGAHKDKANLPNELESVSHQASPVATDNTSPLRTSLRGIVSRAKSQSGAEPKYVVHKKEWGKRFSRTKAAGGVGGDGGAGSQDFVYAPYTVHEVRSRTRSDDCRSNMITLSTSVQRADVLRPLPQSDSALDDKCGSRTDLRSSAMSRYKQFLKQNTPPVGAVITGHSSRPPTPRKPISTHKATKKTQLKKSVLSAAKATGCQVVGKKAKSAVGKDNENQEKTKKKTKGKTEECAPVVESAANTKPKKLAEKKKPLRSKVSCKVDATRIDLSCGDGGTDLRSSHHPSPVANHDGDIKVRRSASKIPTSLLKKRKKSREATSSLSPKVNTRKEADSEKYLAASPLGFYPDRAAVVNRSPSPPRRATVFPRSVHPYRDIRARLFRELVDDDISDPENHLLTEGELANNDLIPPQVDESLFHSPSHNQFRFSEKNNPAMLFSCSSGVCSGDRGQCKEMNASPRRSKSMEMSPSLVTLKSDFPDSEQTSCFLLDNAGRTSGFRLDHANSKRDLPQLSLDCSGTNLELSRLKPSKNTNSNLVPDSFNSAMSVSEEEMSPQIYRLNSPFIEVDMPNNERNMGLKMVHSRTRLTHRTRDSPVQKIRRHQKSSLDSLDRIELSSAFRNEWSGTLVHDNHEANTFSECHFGHLDYKILDTSDDEGHQIATNSPDRKKRHLDRPKKSKSKPRKRDESVSDKSHKTPELIMVKIMKDKQSKDKKKEKRTPNLKETYKIAVENSRIIEASRIEDLVGKSHELSRFHEDVLRPRESFRLQEQHSFRQAHQIRSREPSKTDLWLVAPDRRATLLPPSISETKNIGELTNKPDQPAMWHESDKFNTRSHLPVRVDNYVAAKKRCYVLQQRRRWIEAYAAYTKPCRIPLSINFRKTLETAILEEYALHSWFPSNGQGDHWNNACTRAGNMNTGPLLDIMVTEVSSDRTIGCNLNNQCLTIGKWSAVLSKMKCLPVSCEYFEAPICSDQMTYPTMDRPFTAPCSIVKLWFATTYLKAAIMSWGHRVVTTYSTLSSAFLGHRIVTTDSTVSSVFMLITVKFVDSSEDHRMFHRKFLLCWSIVELYVSQTTHWDPTALLTIVLLCWLIQLSTRNYQRFSCFQPTTTRSILANRQHRHKKANNVTSWTKQETKSIDDQIFNGCLHVPLQVSYLNFKLECGSSSLLNTNNNSSHVYSLSCYTPAVAVRRRKGFTKRPFHFRRNRMSSKGNKMLTSKVKRKNHEWSMSSLLAALVSLTEATRASTGRAASSDSDNSLYEQNNNSRRPGNHNKQSPLKNFNVSSLKTEKSMDSFDLQARRKNRAFRPKPWKVVQAIGNTNVQERPQENVDYQNCNQRNISDKIKGRCLEKCNLFKDRHHSLPHKSQNLIRNSAAGEIRQEHGGQNKDGSNAVDMTFFPDNLATVSFSSKEFKEIAVKANHGVGLEEGSFESGNNRSKREVHTKRRKLNSGDSPSFLAFYERCRGCKIDETETTEASGSTFKDKKLSAAKCARNLLDTKVSAEMQRKVKALVDSYKNFLQSEADVIVPSGHLATNNNGNTRTHAEGKIEPLARVDVTESLISPSSQDKVFCLNALSGATEERLAANGQFFIKSKYMPSFHRDLSLHEFTEGNFNNHPINRIVEPLSMTETVNDSTAEPTSPMYTDILGNSSKVDKGSYRCRTSAKKHLKTINSGSATRQADRLNQFHRTNSPVKLQRVSSNGQTELSGTKKFTPKDDHRAGKNNCEFKNCQLTFGLNLGTNQCPVERTRHPGQKHGSTKTNNCQMLSNTRKQRKYGLDNLSTRSRSLLKKDEIRQNLNNEKANSQHTKKIDSPMNGKILENIHSKTVISMQRSSLVLGNDSKIASRNLTCSGQALQRSKIPTRTDASKGVKRAPALSINASLSPCTQRPDHTLRSEAAKSSAMRHPQLLMCLPTTTNEKFATSLITEEQRLNEKCKQSNSGVGVLQHTIKPLALTNKLNTNMPFSYMREYHFGRRNQQVNDDSCHRVCVNSPPACRPSLVQILKKKQKNDIPVTSPVRKKKVIPMLAPKVESSSKHYSLKSSDSSAFCCSSSFRSDSSAHSIKSVTFDTSSPETKASRIKTAITSKTSSWNNTSTKAPNWLVEQAGQEQGNVEQPSSWPNVSAQKVSPMFSAESDLMVSPGGPISTAEKESSLSTMRSIPELPYNYSSFDENERASQESIWRQLKEARFFHSARADCNFSNRQLLRALSEPNVTSQSKTLTRTTKSLTFVKTSQSIWNKSVQSFSSMMSTTSRTYTACQSKAMAQKLRKKCLTRNRAFKDISTATQSVNNSRNKHCSNAIRAKANVILFSPKSAVTSKNSRAFNCRKYTTRKVKTLTSRESVKATPQTLVKCNESKKPSPRTFTGFSSLLNFWENRGFGITNTMQRIFSSFKDSVVPKEVKVESIIEDRDSDNTTFHSLRETKKRSSSSGYTILPKESFYNNFKSVKRHEFTLPDLPPCVTLDFIKNLGKKTYQGSKMFASSTLSSNNKKQVGTLRHRPTKPGRVSPGGKCRPMSSQNVQFNKELVITRRAVPESTAASQHECCTTSSVGTTPEHDKAELVVDVCTTLPAGSDFELKRNQFRGNDVCMTHYDSSNVPCDDELMGGQQEEMPVTSFDEILDRNCKPRLNRCYCHSLEQCNTDRNSTGVGDEGKSWCDCSNKTYNLGHFSAQGRQLKTPCDSKAGGQVNVEKKGQSMNKDKSSGQVIKKSPLLKLDNNLRLTGLSQKSYSRLLKELSKKRKKQCARKESGARRSTRAVECKNIMIRASYISLNQTGAGHNTEETGNAGDGHDAVESRNTEGRHKNAGNRHSSEEKRNVGERHTAGEKYNAEAIQNTGDTAKDRQTIKERKNAGDRHNVGNRHPAVEKHNSGERHIAGHIHPNVERHTAVERHNAEERLNAGDRRHSEERHIAEVKHTVGERHVTLRRAHTIDGFNRVSQYSLCEETGEPRCADIFNSRKKSLQVNDSAGHWISPRIVPLNKNNFDASQRSPVQFNNKKDAPEMGSQDHLNSHITRIVQKLEKQTRIKHRMNQQKIIVTGMDSWSRQDRSVFPAFNGFFNYDKYGCFETKHCDDLSHRSIDPVEDEDATKVAPITDVLTFHHFDVESDESGHEKDDSGKPSEKTEGLESTLLSRNAMIQSKVEWRDLRTVQQQQTKLTADAVMSSHLIHNQNNKDIVSEAHSRYVPKVDILPSKRQRKDYVGNDEATVKCKLQEKNSSSSTQQEYLGSDDKLAGTTTNRTGCTKETSSTIVHQTETKSEDCKLVNTEYQCTEVVGDTDFQPCTFFNDKSDVFNKSCQCPSSPQQRSIAPSQRSLSNGSISAKNNSEINGGMSSQNVFVKDMYILLLQKYISQGELLESAVKCKGKEMHMKLNSADKKYSKTMKKLKTFLQNTLINDDKTVMGSMQERVKPCTHTGVNHSTPHLDKKLNINKDDHCAQDAESPKTKLASPRNTVDIQSDQIFLKETCENAVNESQPLVKGCQSRYSEKSLTSCDLNEVANILECIVAGKKHAKGRTNNVANDSNDYCRLDSRTPTNICSRKELKQTDNAETQTIDLFNHIQEIDILSDEKESKFALTYTVNEKSAEEILVNPTLNVLNCMYKPKLIVGESPTSQLEKRWEIISMAKDRIPIRFKSFSEHSQTAKKSIKTSSSSGSLKCHADDVGDVDFEYVISTGLDYNSDSSSRSLEMSNEPVSSSAVCSTCGPSVKRPKPSVHQPIKPTDRDDDCQCKTLKRCCGEIHLAHLNVRSDFGEKRRQCHCESETTNMASILDRKSRLVKAIEPSLSKMVQECTGSSSQEIASYLTAGHNTLHCRDEKTEAFTSTCPLEEQASSQPGDYENIVSLDDQKIETGQDSRNKHYLALNRNLFKMTSTSISSDSLTPVVANQPTELSQQQHVQAAKNRKYYRQSMASESHLEIPVLGRSPSFVVNYSHDSVSTTENTSDNGLQCIPDLHFLNNCGKKPYCKKNLQISDIYEKKNSLCKTRIRTHQKRSNTLDMKLKQDEQISLVKPMDTGDHKNAKKDSKLTVICCKARRNEHFMQRPDEISKNHIILRSESIHTVKERNDKYERPSPYLDIDALSVHKHMTKRSRTADRKRDRCMSREYVTDLKMSGDKKTDVNNVLLEMRQDDCVIPVVVTKTLGQKPLILETPFPNKSILREECLPKSFVSKLPLFSSAELELRLEGTLKSTRPSSGRRKKLCEWTISPITKPSAAAALTMSTSVTNKHHYHSNERLDDRSSASADSVKKNIQVGHNKKTISKKGNRVLKSRRSNNNKDVIPVSNVYHANRHRQDIDLNSSNAKENRNIVPFKQIIPSQEELSSNNAIAKRKKTLLQSDRKIRRKRKQTKSLLHRREKKCKHKIDEKLKLAMRKLYDHKTGIKENGVSQKPENSQSESVGRYRDVEIILGKDISYEKFASSFVSGIHHQLNHESKDTASRNDPLKNEVQLVINKIFGNAPETNFSPTSAPYGYHNSKSGVILFEYCDTQGNEHKGREQYRNAINDDKSRILELNTCSSHFGGVTGVNDKHHFRIHKNQKHQYKRTSAHRTPLRKKKCREASHRKYGAGSAVDKLNSAHQSKITKCQDFASTIFEHRHKAGAQKWRETDKILGNLKYFAASKSVSDSALSVASSVPRNARSHELDDHNAEPTYGDKKLDVGMPVRKFPVEVFTISKPNGYKLEKITKVNNVLINTEASPFIVHNIIQGNKDWVKDRKPPVCKEANQGEPRRTNVTASDSSHSDQIKCKDQYCVCGDHEVNNYKMRVRYDSLTQHSGSVLKRTKRLHDVLLEMERNKVLSLDEPPYYKMSEDDVHVRNDNAHKLRKRRGKMDTKLSRRKIPYKVTRAAQTNAESASSSTRTSGHTLTLVTSSEPSSLPHSEARQDILILARDSQLIKNQVATRSLQCDGYDGSLETTREMKTKFHKVSQSSKSSKTHADTPLQLQCNPKGTQAEPLRSSQSSLAQEKLNEITQIIENLINPKNARSHNNSVKNDSSDLKCTYNKGPAPKNVSELKDNPLEYLSQVAERPEKSDVNLKVNFNTTSDFNETSKIGNRSTMYEHPRSLSHISNEVQLMSGDTEIRQQNFELSSQATSVAHAHEELVAMKSLQMSAISNIAYDPCSSVLHYAVISTTMSNSSNVETTAKLIAHAPKPDDDGEKLNSEIEVISSSARGKLGERHGDIKANDDYQMSKKEKHNCDFKANYDSHMSTIEECHSDIKPNKDSKMFKREEHKCDIKANNDYQNCKIEQHKCDIKTICNGVKENYLQSFESSKKNPVSVSHVAPEFRLKAPCTFYTPADNVSVTLDTHTRDSVQKRCVKLTVPQLGAFPQYNVFVEASSSEDGPPKVVTENGYVHVSFEKHIELKLEKPDKLKGKTEDDLSEAESQHSVNSSNMGGMQGKVYLKENLAVEIADGDDLKRAEKPQILTSSVFEQKRSHSEDCSSDVIHDSGPLPQPQHSVDEVLTRADTTYNSNKVKLMELSLSSALSSPHRQEEMSTFHHQEATGRSHEESSFYSGSTNQMTPRHVTTRNDHVRHVTSNLPLHSSEFFEREVDKNLVTIASMLRASREPHCLKEAGAEIPSEGDNTFYQTAGHSSFNGRMKTLDKPQDNSVVETRGYKEKIKSIVLNRTKLFHTNQDPTQTLVGDVTKAGENMTERYKTTDSDAGYKALHPIDDGMRLRVRDVGVKDSILERIYPRQGNATMATIQRESNTAMAANTRDFSLRDGEANLEKDSIKNSYFEKWSIRDGDMSHIVSKFLESDSNSGKSVKTLGIARDHCVVDRSNQLTTRISSRTMHMPIKSAFVLSPGSPSVSSHVKYMSSELSKSDSVKSPARSPIIHSLPVRLKVDPKIQEVKSETMSVTSNDDFEIPNRTYIPIKNTENRSTKDEFWKRSFTDTVALESGEGNSAKEKYRLDTTLLRSESKDVSWTHTSGFQDFSLAHGKTFSEQPNWKRIGLLHYSSSSSPEQKSPRKLRDYSPSNDDSDSDAQRLVGSKVDATKYLGRDHVTLRERRLKRDSSGDSITSDDNLSFADDVTRSTEEMFRQRQGSSETDDLLSEGFNKGRLFIKEKEHKLLSTFTGTKAKRLVAEPISRRPLGLETSRQFFERPKEFNVNESLSKAKPYTATHTEPLNRGRTLSEALMEPVKRGRTFSEVHKAPLSRDGALSEAHKAPMSKGRHFSEVGRDESSFKHNVKDNTSSYPERGGNLTHKPLQKVNDHVYCQGELKEFDDPGKLQKNRYGDGTVSRRETNFKRKVLNEYLFSPEKMSNNMFDFRPREKYNRLRFSQWNNTPMMNLTDGVYASPSYGSTRSREDTKLHLSTDCSSEESSPRFSPRVNKLSLERLLHLSDSEENTTSNSEKTSVESPYIESSPKAVSNSKKIKLSEFSSTLPSEACTSQRYSDGNTSSGLESSLEAGAGKIKTSDANLPSESDTQSPRRTPHSSLASSKSPRAGLYRVRFSDEVQQFNIPVVDADCTSKPTVVKNKCAECLSDKQNDSFSDNFESCGDNAQMDDNHIISRKTSNMSYYRLDTEANERTDSLYHHLNDSVPRKLCDHSGKTGSSNDCSLDPNASYSNKNGPLARDGGGTQAHDWADSGYSTLSTPNEFSGITEWDIAIQKKLAQRREQMMVRPSPRVALRGKP